jgi:hypothetical protein
LYQPSSQLNTVMRASALLLKLSRLISSRFRLTRQLSAIAFAALAEGSDEDPRSSDQAQAQLA